MQEGKTINEFIDYLMLKYDIVVEPELESKVNHNIRMKINRTINKSSILLKKYNDLPEKRISKTKAKVFSKEFCDEIEREICNYLLSFNEVNVEEYMATKSFLEQVDSNDLLFNVVVDNYIKTPNSDEFRITGELDEDFKIKLFIEHMFYSQFTFDESRYALDIHNYLDFKNNKELLDVTDIVQIVTRLRNPHKYYFKKKK